MARWSADHLATSHEGPAICSTTAFLGTAASGGHVKLYLPGSGSVYAGPHASVTVVTTPVGVAT